MTSKTPKKKTRRAGVRVSSAIRPTGSTAARNQPARKTQSVRQPKPKTAYELLERVCDHILEEPLRYFQGTWVERNKRRIQDEVGTVPPCGTIACRAGWIVALNDGLNSQTIRTSIAGSSSFIEPIQQRANEILGTTTFDTSDLFNGAALHRSFAFDIPPAGTRAYARLGVRGLRIFMRDNAKHLKARLLKDVPKLGSEGQ